MVNVAPIHIGPVSSNRMWPATLSLAVAVASLLVAFMLPSTMGLAADSHTTIANRAWGQKGGGQDAAEKTATVVILDLEDAAVAASTVPARDQFRVCYFSVGTSEPFRPDYKASLCLL